MVVGLVVTGCLAVIFAICFTAYALDVFDRGTRELRDELRAARTFSRQRGNALHERANLAQSRLDDLEREYIADEEISLNRQLRTDDRLDALEADTKRLRADLGIDRAHADRLVAGLRTAYTAFGHALEGRADG